MPTLVVPGVQVQARFDVLPPLPAPSGIVGVVGVVDRPPDPVALVPVTKSGELIDLLGPGTLVSLPDAVHALTNGASEVVVSPVVGETVAASVQLQNANGANTIQLRMRSDGGWGNQVRADVRAVTVEGNVVRSTIRLLRFGEVLEEFADARIEAGAPDDLFERINGRSRYVVALDSQFGTARPEAAVHAFDADTVSIDVPNTAGAPLFTMTPAQGVDPVGLSVEFVHQTRNRVQVRVTHGGGLQEDLPNLEMNPDSANHLPYVLMTRSRFIRVAPRTSRPPELALPATQGPLEFEGGRSPSLDDYRAAIDRLADDSRVDLVVASPDPTLTEAQVHGFHQALVAHAETMAETGAPRIAFGALTAGEEQRNEAQRNLELIRNHSALVRSRRFVLVAPAGAAGAVAGLIGRMNPQESPTFKTVPLSGIPPATFREGELNRLLGSTTNLLVVQDRAGRGVIVLKGIDTTGDQISVTRVADQAIRETKNIAEGFIGRLNDNNAREALKQQLVATFTRMERQGALVPSTDGTDPAFLVDVYSTQLDFAQGIVRIDIAVRPVRAIDYVYATIRVKN